MEISLKVQFRCNIVRWKVTKRAKGNNFEIVFLTNNNAVKAMEFVVE